MPNITTSEEYWSAHISSPNGVMKADRDAARALIQRLGIAGKGLRRRYLSDVRFKTEDEAKRFWEPHMTAHPLLRRTLEISKMFDLIF